MGEAHLCGPSSIMSLVLCGVYMGCGRPRLIARALGRRRLCAGQHTVHRERAAGVLLAVRALMRPCAMGSPCICGSAALVQHWISALACQFPQVSSLLSAARLGQHAQAARRGDVRLGRWRHQKTPGCRRTALHAGWLLLRPLARLPLQRPGCLCGLQPGAPGRHIPCRRGHARRQRRAGLRSRRRAARAVHWHTRLLQHAGCLQRLQAQVPERGQRGRRGHVRQHVGHRWRERLPDH